MNTNLFAFGYLLGRTTSIGYLLQFGMVAKGAFKNRIDIKPERGGEQKREIRVRHWHLLSVYFVLDSIPRICFHYLSLKSPSRPLEGSGIIFSRMGGICSDEESKV